jgi:CDP-diacylglycerol--serine O-phosphatidyltransferase
MAENKGTSPTAQPDAEEPKLKIYFLPNLLTAGNLFCGFVALTKIVEANLDPDISGVIHWGPIKLALAFILLACIFDLFDGRVARMGGVESPFGREFDSLADIISFGAAPAFLIHSVVLRDVFKNHPQVGWLIASAYLLCGAFRLARFNCLAAMSGGGGGKEFLGFPIPAAAGLVSSMTLLIIQMNEKDRSLGGWNYVIAFVLVFLSAMMVSTVKYPSFKSLGIRSRSTFTKSIVGGLLIGSVVILREKILIYVLPVVFTVYLLWGFVRLRVSRKMRHDVEEEDDEDEENEGSAGMKS